MAVVQLNIGIDDNPATVTVTTGAISSKVMQVTVASDTDPAAVLKCIEILKQYTRGRQSNNQKFI